MASSYAAFANHGYKTPAFGITRITTARGEIVWEAQLDAPRERVLAFARVLQEGGYVTTIRKTRGDDIDAACGGDGGSHAFGDLSLATAVVALALAANLLAVCGPARFAFLVSLLAWSAASAKVSLVPVAGAIVLHRGMSRRAARKRAIDKSAPAANSPGGSCRACSGSGKGVSGSSQIRRMAGSIWR